MGNVYHGKVPDVFERMFVYNNVVYHHDTRISNDLQPLKLPQIYPEIAWNVTVPFFGMKFLLLLSNHICLKCLTTSYENDGVLQEVRTFTNYI